MHLSLSLSESMDEFLDRSPSEDEDPPFPITAPSELDDSECDQGIELGSATNPLVNSSGTNLNPDIRVEQQSEPQSLSELLFPELQTQLELLTQLKLQLQFQLKLQRQFQLEFDLQCMLKPQHQLELQCQRQLELELKRQRQLQLKLHCQLQHLNQLSVDERYNQELYCLFNMFHDYEINAKKLDTALKSLEEKYYYLGTDHHRFIHCGDVAGTSLSRLEGAGSSGYPSTSGYPPGTNACAAAVPIGIRLGNNSGDPSSSVKHSSPGKGKAPLEEGARGFADVSGDAIGSMNASREGDLEMGLVNSNADPSALGDVRSSVVHHVDHTTAGSGVSRPNVAMTSIQLAAAACGAAKSEFARAFHTASLTTSMAARLLDDTKWKAATPILTKAGNVVCGVGVLADLGKDLPLALFLVAISTALLIIIVAILCAKRPT
ncbi:unnamed protein product [Camellia sinensis]